MTSKKQSWWGLISIGIVIGFLITILIISATAKDNIITFLGNKYKLTEQENWEVVAWKNETIKKFIRTNDGDKRDELIKQGCEYEGNSGIILNVYEFICEIREQIPTIEGKDCRIFEIKNIYFEQGKGTLCYIGDLKTQCSESCDNMTSGCGGGCVVWCEPSFISKTICSACRDYLSKEEIICPNPKPS